MMTFNVLEYCRAIDLPLVFSSTREVYGDVHRFEGTARTTRRLRLHREPLLGVEDRLRGVHLLLREVLRPPLPRLPLLERLWPLRQRPRAGWSACSPVHPPALAGRADHRLRRRGQGARLHLHRRLRRRHRRGDRAARRRPVANETINLAYGEGNTLVQRGRADRRRTRRDTRIAGHPRSWARSPATSPTSARRATLLGWSPHDAACQGIPRAVALVRGWRTRAPRARSLEPSPRATAAEVRPAFDPGAVRPTPRASSRSTARRRAARAPSPGARRASRRRGRLRRLGGALRGARDPHRRVRARRRGSSVRPARPRRLGRRLPAARARRDRRAPRRPAAPGPRRRHRPLPAGGARGDQLPPPPAAGVARRGWSGSTTSSGPRRRTRCSASGDPAAAARVHPTTAAASSARSS